MPSYTHGGDLVAAQREYGGVVLDFSANLNPLGMPEKVRAAAERAVAGACAYPDALCRTLRAGIALRDRVSQEQIVCGCGAADLIFRLAFSLRPRHALLTAPTFSEYEAALGAAGCGVRRHPLREEADFALTGDVLDALTREVDLCFLCSPNNPTGREIPAPLMEEILGRCRDLGILLVVDECFLDLSDGAGPGLAPRIGEYPDLVLLRAFTKSYAMPGLRLGYCLTHNEGLREKLYAGAQPWAVSGPAQAAGLAALECPDWPERARRLIEVERPFLAGGLTALGVKVYPGQANYLLFRADGIGDLKQRLLARGVLVRSCANYHGLGPDYYRIAVRTRPENERLLRAVEEVL